MGACARQAQHRGCAACGEGEGSESEGEESEEEESGEEESGEGEGEDE